VEFDCDLPWTSFARASISFVFHCKLLWLFHCVISGGFKQLHWDLDLSLSDWSAFWLLHLLQLIALNLLSAFERPAPLTA